MTTQDNEPTVNTKNRCDGCGAQAYVSVMLNGGTILLFCGNHWNRHKHILNVPENVVNTDALDSLHKQVEAEVTV